jgi:hypothetical protein
VSSFYILNFKHSYEIRNTWSSFYSPLSPIISSDDGHGILFVPPDDVSKYLKLVLFSKFCVMQIQ